MTIDGKSYSIDLENNNDYKLLSQGLHFKKAALSAIPENEINGVLLPLPQIPMKTFDLIITGIITDTKGNKNTFSYNGEGVLVESEYDWKRPVLVMP